MECTRTARPHPISVARAPLSPPVPARLGPLAGPVWLCRARVGASPLGGPVPRVEWAASRACGVWGVVCGCGAYISACAGGGAALCRVWQCGPALPRAPRPGARGTAAARAISPPTFFDIFSSCVCVIFSHTSRPEGAGRTDKNLCRCFGAPARRVFPDHLITSRPHCVCVCRSARAAIVFVAPPPPQWREFTHGASTPHRKGQ